MPELDAPAPAAAAEIRCFLALDLATKTGWALQTPTGVFSGTVDLSGNRFEGGGMRFLRFANWLRESFFAAGVSRPEAVLYEHVIGHTGTTAAQIYGGLVAHLTALCETNRTPYQGVKVGDIKRFATGKGNAAKDAVIDGVRARGFDPKDDNEADALALMLWGRRHLPWRP